MYWGDGDELMKGPTAAAVNFFLLMYVKRLLLSLTPLLRYDTHTHTHTHTHTKAKAKAKAKSTAAAFAVTPPGYKRQVSCALRRIFGPVVTNPPETGPVCTRRR